MLPSVLHPGDAVMDKTDKTLASQSSHSLEGRQTHVRKCIRDAWVAQNTVNKIDERGAAGWCSRSGAREGLSEERKSDHDPKEE